MPPDFVLTQQEGQEHEQSPVMHHPPHINVTPHPVLVARKPVDAFGYQHSKLFGCSDPDALWGEGGGRRGEGGGGRRGGRREKGGGRREKGGGRRGEEGGGERREEGGGEGINLPLAGCPQGADSALCSHALSPTKVFQEVFLRQLSGQEMTTVLCLMPPRPALWML